MVWYHRLPTLLRRRCERFKKINQPSVIQNSKKFKSESASEVRRKNVPVICSASTFSLTPRADVNVLRDKIVVSIIVSCVHELLTLKKEKVGIKFFQAELGKFGHASSRALLPSAHVTLRAKKLKRTAGLPTSF